MNHLLYLNMAGNLLYCCEKEVLIATHGCGGHQVKLAIDIWPSFVYVCWSLFSVIESSLNGFPSIPDYSEKTVLLKKLVFVFPPPIEKEVLLVNVTFL